MENVVVRRLAVSSSAWLGRLGRSWVIVFLACHSPHLFWQQPPRVVQEIVSERGAGEMERRMMLLSLPVLTFGASPWNPSIARCLRVLTESPQATKERQIVCVDRDAVMEISVRAAHGLTSSSI